ncbi:MAG: alpha/beta fold hydrolase [Dermatophilus congolensis]|nr:alpha/beta fold hydrolase [Dermatophilus congolensis]
MNSQVHRPSRGASISPSGSGFAHIVDSREYPHIVQRYLDGLVATASRDNNVPVSGPVIKVLHSEDGYWVACEIAPKGTERTQVWIVTTDPGDPIALRVDEGEDTAARLVAWDGALLAITIFGAEGMSESRLVDPRTLEHRVIDTSRLGLLADARDGAILLRTGRRGQHRLLYRDDTHELHLYPHELDSVTDRGRLLRMRGSDGSRRILVRTDHGGAFARLDEVTIAEGAASARTLAARDGCELDDFVVSLDESTAALLWNVDGGRSELQLFDLLSERLSAPVHLPGAVLSEPSISADGSLVAVTMEGPGQAPTVVVIDTASRRWAPVDHVPPVASAVQPDRLRFTAPDGTPLEGWLYRPAGVRGPGPLLLWLHGGPESQFRPGCRGLMAAAVEAGITVFAPNVRGSTGYGKRFAHADDQARRFAAIADVRAAAVEMVARGIADPDRIAIAGHSYGGYLTWTALAMYPDLFACGIPVCGMSSLVTFYESTEPWIAAASYSKYGHPVRDPDFLRALSALPIIDQVRVPVLALHGRNDTDVALTESTQAVEALVARGIDARVEIFEGEGHTFAKPATLRTQVELTIDFLNRHLG